MMDTGRSPSHGVSNDGTRRGPCDGRRGRSDGHVPFYAHTLPGRPPEEWQPLEEHLRNVAELAAEFARPFGAEEWARIAGLWHDLGKYSEAFQTYLRTAASEDYHEAELRGRVDHTSAGAQYAVATVEVLGHLLAYPIAGHHAGLLDAIADGACLERRLTKPVEAWYRPPVASTVPPELALPPFLERALARRAADPAAAAFSFSFFVRMLFSCLVDADFLDTERFMEPARAEGRPRWPDDVLARMEVALDRYVTGLAGDDSPVNLQRRRVRQACLDAATDEPGLFSLTVPTGGGKTLASLAFALRHAQRHGLGRIIYVIPFTSIIEQNASVFREAFQPLVKAGLPDPVLEHHSAVDAGKETVESRLAAENWDAPLIVTTSVQFYESLFANRTKRCRKLHNLAGSVIILDEAQKIPVDYLRPCLLILRELATNYGSSVVLCTATQPAVARRDGFPIGLEGVREIIPDPPALYVALKRVEVKYLGRLGDEELAGRLLGHDRVLCIVNTRRHAREIYERLGEDGIHLSAAMCPEHRSAVLDAIRSRLKRSEPCRVISTQLVEAGVDLDFPIVYRCLAGLDSIAQAAGRCNRNGRLDKGLTCVFRSEHEELEAFLRDTTGAASQILGGGDATPLYEDLLSLEAVEHYFRLYYWSQQERWDARGILDALKLAGGDPKLPFQFNFRTIASRFKLIAETGQAVIVPWGERGAELVERLRASFPLPDRDLLRRLQRYTVQVRKKTYFQHIGRTIETVHDRYPVLISPELHYDERLGLVLDREHFEPARS